MYEENTNSYRTHVHLTCVYTFLYLVVRPSFRRTFNVSIQISVLLKCDQTFFHSWSYLEVMQKILKRVLTGPKSIFYKVGWLVTENKGPPHFYREPPNPCECTSTSMCPRCTFWSALYLTTVEKCNNSSQKCAFHTIFFLFERGRQDLLIDISHAWYIYIHSCRYIWLKVGIDSNLQKFGRTAHTSFNSWAVQNLREFTTGHQCVRVVPYGKNQGHFQDPVQR